MHAKALTRKATELFPQFRRFKGFYLVGGTALALQIGHRISVDFDMFSEQKLPVNLLKRVKQIFSGSEISVTYRAPGQLNILIDKVQTTFFEYEYPVINALLKHQGVAIASIREISAMKAFFIGRRLSYKDYIDWYFMLKGRYVSLGEVIKLAKKNLAESLMTDCFSGNSFLLKILRPKR
jgi:hypothetical protein